MTAATIQEAFFYPPAQRSSALRRTASGVGLMLFALLVLLSNPVHSQEIIYSGETVVGIEGLVIGPGTYRVTFDNVPFIGAYGNDPTVYDFKNVDDARTAIQAIVDVFNADGTVKQVGDNDVVALPFFRIAFATVDTPVPIFDKDVRLSTIWEAIVPNDLAPTEWIRLPDPDFFPLLDDGSVALFTLTAGEPLSTYDFKKRVLFSNPASNEIQQSFLRFVNTCDAQIDVQVKAADDEGLPAPDDKVSFKLDPYQALQLTAQDLENGNPGKGLEGDLGQGSGKWQMSVESSCEVEIFSNIRTPDGFLTGLDETVDSDENGCKNIAFANPAENTNQQTFLRFVNRSSKAGDITLSAIDDNGDAAVDGEVFFRIESESSKQMTAQDLENGNPGLGLEGKFGNGAGKWRILACYDETIGLDVDVMSLIRTPDGFLTNLSSPAPKALENPLKSLIWFANPASETAQETLIRVVNKTETLASVTMTAIDDNGDTAPFGPVTFALNPREAKQLTASDLENGNLDKELEGSFGDGTGKWQILVQATVDVDVLNQIRTPDGFLTNISLPVDKNKDTLINDVGIFNPAENVNQRSLLRVVNVMDAQCSVTITGRDDAGIDAPLGAVTFDLGAREAKQITAQDLEDGNQMLGLTGALGNGAGKWHLFVQPSANCELEVFSLLDTPTGFLTNLSRATSNL
jgi:hypothetical protein